MLKIQKILSKKEYRLDRRQVLININNNNNS